MFFAISVFSFQDFAFCYEVFDSDSELAIMLKRFKFFPQRK